MRNLTIPCFECLVVRAGRTFDLITHTNSLFVPKGVFWGYSNMHKGFKCLDVSTGRIYISRDVIFDEHVFPFSELHANAGAKLREEISLFP